MVGSCVSFARVGVGAGQMAPLTGAAEGPHGSSLECRGEGAIAGKDEGLTLEGDPAEILGGMQQR